MDSSASPERLQARVLVVDDDEALLALVSSLLADLGHHCRSAATARGAFAILEGEPIDVLLADIRMPETDGFALIRQARERWPELDVIMMTAYDMEYSYIDVIEAGSTDFLVKPFRSDELQAKIQRILRERNLRRDLIERSLHDSLTGLYNQRCFYQRLTEEVTRARRQHHQLSLLFLDLDRFKEYNDVSGHLEGDTVLNGLGRILTASIRRNVDSAYRVGGDEFAVLLVEAGEVHATEVAERLRSSLESSDPDGCTISVGIALLDDRDDGQGLLRRADLAMFQAKRDGGNRVEVAPAAPA
jgi:diguanylate cyclase (GGDEF)-like protein